MTDRFLLAALACYAVAIAATFLNHYDIGFAAVVIATVLTVTGVTND